MKYTIISIAFITSFLLSSCSWTNSTPSPLTSTGVTTCQAHEILADSVCVPFSGSGKNIDLFTKDFTKTVQTFEINEGDLHGYYAEPIEDKDFPGIVMIHEWWGLNDNIKYMAKLLASSGYKVFAIDLYGEVATTPEKAKELSSKVRENPQIALNKMEHALNFLKLQESVKQFGTLGWCFGGGESLDISLANPVDATVIYYWSLTDDISKLSKLKGPVLGIFGDKDTVIPLNSITQFQNHLNDLGKKNTFYIYPWLGHAFANPSGANYASGQTVDAWEKTLKFLSETLKK